VAERGRWPELPLAAWRDSKETLHRYAQIVGKVRLALAPFRNHWWHVVLYVTTRGVTTGPMPADDRTLDITFDFIDHRLVVTVDDGAVASFSLAHGVTVADFHRELFAVLDGLGLRPRIHAEPFDLEPPPFPDDTEHHRYDPAWVARWWRVLQQAERVLTEFAGWFNGKQSPAQLYWHSLDLAMGRYSGRPAPRAPDTDPVTAEAYSHEVISFGFWAGDATIPYPAFYSYTAPEPPGLTAQPLRPAGAAWQPSGGMALLAYDDVRDSGDPRAALLEFFDSAYEAGATTAGWDVAAFATRADPKRPS
jgi:hypothetical protein